MTVSPMDVGDLVRYQSVKFILTINQHKPVIELVDLMVLSHQTLHIVI